MKTAAQNKISHHPAFAVLASLAMLFLSMPSYATNNPFNVELLSLPPNRQAEKLGEAVQMFGDVCIGRTAFYMGDDKDTDAFWSVKCTNGKSYAVELKPDGTGTILECEVIQAMHAGRCFKKFEPD